MTETTAAVLVAVLANAALVLAALIQRFRGRQQKVATAVDIIQDVNSELRIELGRVNTERQAEVSRLGAEVARLNTQVEELRGQLMSARDDSRSAHETTGRAMRRVEHLETVLRQHGISYQPGPLA